MQDLERSSRSGYVCTLSADDGLSAIVFRQDARNSRAAGRVEFAEGNAMFFRFGAALLLVVLVALIGAMLETQNLALKRSLSQQQYRMEVLQETQVRLRLESQRLGTPARLFEALQQADAELHRPPKPQRADQRRAPLLNWNSPSGRDRASRDVRQPE